MTGNLVSACLRVPLKYENIRQFLRRYDLEDRTEKQKLKHAKLKDPIMEIGIVPLCEDIGLEGIGYGDEYKLHLGYEPIRNVWVVREDAIFANEYLVFHKSDPENRVYEFVSYNPLLLPEKVIPNLEKYLK